MKRLDFNGTLARILKGLNPFSITPTYNQCTAGGYNRCYKIGRIVILSFNIDITTATASYDYITGLPKPLGGGWACSGAITAGSAMRFWVTPDGTLRTDGNAYAGWVNGNVTYISES